MLTPIEIQGKVFKSGIGYDKKDVDSFCREILSNYEVLYKENVELTDKISVLNDGIQYYKTIEKTLQKALVLAEKTAEETKEAANQKALSIEKDAHASANLILADAKNELNRIHFQTIELVQQYNKYRIQFQKMAETQIELLKSNGFNIDIANVDTIVSKGIDNLNTLSDKEEKLANMEEQEHTKEYATSEGMEMVHNTNSMDNDNNDEQSALKQDEDFEFINLDI